MKILEIPKEFRQMLTPFRQFMTAPQFKHFTRYVFGLIVAEKKKKTVEGINAIYADRKDRGNLTRFMIKSPVEMEPILNKALERHWRHLNIHVGFTLFLLIDDSDTEKSGTLWRVLAFSSATAERSDSSSGITSCSCRPP